MKKSEVWRKKIHFQLLQAAVPLAGTAPEQAKQIVSEHHKAAKQYKKAFDFVLTGKLRSNSSKEGDEFFNTGVSKA